MDVLNCYSTKMLNIISLVVMFRFIFFVLFYPHYFLYPVLEAFEELTGATSQNVGVGVPVADEKEEKEQDDDLFFVSQMTKVVEAGSKDDALAAAEAEKQVEESGVEVKLAKKEALGGKTKEPVIEDVVPAKKQSLVGTVVVPEALENVVNPVVSSGEQVAKGT